MGGRCLVLVRGLFEGLIVWKLMGYWIVRFLGEYEDGGIWSCGRRISLFHPLIVSNWPGH